MSRRWSHFKMIAKPQGDAEMITQVKEHTMYKRLGAKRVFAIGLPFLVAGILMASGLQWTRPSIAKDITGGSHVSATAPPAMPSSFADLAEKMSPTVVNVKVTKVEKATFQRPHGQQGPMDDFFGQFFNQMPQMPRNHRTQGAGSGVIISDDGYILTNNHVVEDANEVTVTLADKKEYEAKVVGLDPKNRPCGPEGRR